MDKDNAEHGLSQHHRADRRVSQSKRHRIRIRVDPFVPAHPANAMNEFSEAAEGLAIDLRAEFSGKAVVEPSGPVSCNEGKSFMTYDAENHSSFHSVSKLLDPIWHKLQQERHCSEKGRTFLSSGFSELDFITDGFRAGSVSVIGGRPCMGTTSLALNIAQNVALEQRGTVVVFSLDFDGPEAVLRILCGASGVDRHRMLARCLNEHEKVRIQDAYERLQGAPLYVEDGAVGLTEIDRIIASMVAFGMPPKLVVIDNLQMLAPNIKNAAKTEAIVRGIRAMAQDVGAPVILTTNLSRRIERRRYRHPMWRDIPSGVITGGADLVLLICREQHFSDNRGQSVVVDLTVARNRFGPVGCVELNFRADCGLFSSRLRTL